MATEQEAEAVRETSTVPERSLRNRDLYLFLPFLLGFSGQESQEGDGDVASTRERVILVNPFTQGMIVLEESSGLNPLFRGLLESREEGGHPPASKASIDAMPVVDVDGCGGECVICLEEWKAEEIVKEMPCKHRFHGGCIEKWLGVHGSCPVCRYEMPVDGDEVGTKTNEGREIWVRFSFGGGGRRVRDSSGQDGGNSDGDGTRPVVESED